MAHAAFPKGHPYLTLRDHLGRFPGRGLCHAVSGGGLPGAAPVAAGLRNGDAVSRESVRSPSRRGGAARIDWKYLSGWN